VKFAAAAAAVLLVAAAARAEPVNASSLAAKDDPSAASAAADRATTSPRVRLDAVVGFDGSIMDRVRLDLPAATRPKPVPLVVWTADASSKIDVAVRVVPAPVPPSPVGGADAARLQKEVASLAWSDVADSAGPAARDAPKIDDVEVDAVASPEPATIALFALGVVAVIAAARRR